MSTCVLTLQSVCSLILGVSMLSCGIDAEGRGSSFDPDRSPSPGGGGSALDGFAGSGAAGQAGQAGQVDGGSESPAAGHEGDDAGERIGPAGASGSAGGENEPRLHVENLPIEQDDRDATSEGDNLVLDRCAFSPKDWKLSAGLQWKLPIPQGAKIESARILVYPVAQTPKPNAFVAGIRVEDVDSAKPFKRGKSDVRRRTYWNTLIKWSVPPDGMPVGRISASPELAPLVQHIVNRPGWDAGQVVSFAIWGDGGEGQFQQELADFSEGSGHTSVLQVEWTEPTED